MLEQRLKWKCGGHMSKMDCSRWTYASFIWNPRIGKRAENVQGCFPERDGSAVDEDSEGQAGMENAGKNHHGHYANTIEEILEKTCSPNKQRRC
ncbi:hypothetical protein ANN_22514 [Periplaneta americana]|uniref:Uncharacterized protein n=1 Tax=Periplaneta americana TaxID=6978 RepID=A0ABQ8S8E9_PERAM|nr:hypothetical protein ANN_22514 [Periplaneta americana]